MVSSASSHEILAKRPSPLAPMRFSGWRNRFGPWTNSGYRFATLAQTAPWVMGLTFEPLTETTSSPATVTLRLQVSGQSSGQTLARSTFTMAHSGMRRCQPNPTRRGLLEPAAGSLLLSFGGPAAPHPAIVLHRTDNTEAYTQYLLGNQFRARDTPEAN